MKKILIILNILFLQSTSLCGQIKSNQKSLVITHISVLDVRRERIENDSTVIIISNRINKIGKSSITKIPKNAEIINGSGKYLIPGLWDMHVHFWNDEKLLALYVANGVTGVRDMGGDLNRVKLWREATAKGNLIAPRIIAAPGFPLDGSPFELSLLGLKPIVIKSPSESRIAVDNLKENGGDFIKILSALSSESYFAVVGEAKKKRISFAGHVPETVSAAEASDAGQKSIEHLFGIALACSSRETELRNKRIEAIKQSNWSEYREIENQILDSFDAKKAEKLFKKFARNRTFQTPTLTMLKRTWLRFETDPAKDPRLSLIPPFIKETWGNPAEDLQKIPAERIAYFDRAFKQSLELVKLMRQAKVKIIAGTDMGDSFTFPGSTLYDELELLVQAGLTPMEAIQSATLNAAQYQNLSKSFGTIEKGKIADLILLDANPLKDIRNIRKINAVIFDGKILPSAKLKNIVSQTQNESPEK